MSPLQKNGSGNSSVGGSVDDGSVCSRNARRVAGGGSGSSSVDEQRLGTVQAEVDRLNRATSDQDSSMTRAWLDEPLDEEPPGRDLERMGSGAVINSQQVQYDLFQVGEQVQAINRPDADWVVLEVFGGESVRLQLVGEAYQKKFPMSAVRSVPRPVGRKPSSGFDSPSVATTVSRASPGTARTPKLVRHARWMSTRNAKHEWHLELQEERRLQRMEALKSRLMKSQDCGAGWLKMTPQDGNRQYFWNTATDEMQYYAPGSSPEWEYDSASSEAEWNLVRRDLDSPLSDSGQSCQSSIGDRTMASAPSSECPPSEGSSLCAEGATLPLSCVSTAFAAKTAPFLAVLRGSW